MERASVERSGAIIQLVDDDHAVRRSQAVLLRTLGYKVQTWVDGESFLRAAPSLGPSCLLLDLAMPRMDGLKVQAEMQSRGIHWPIIFLSGTADIPHAVEAVKRGALQFLVKPVPTDELSAALDVALEHLLTSAAKPSGEAAKTRLARLTKRENDVLQGLVEGLPNKTIAYDLGISPRTIEAHRANIMKKLEAPTFAHALKTVFEAHL